MYNFFLVKFSFALRLAMSFSEVKPKSQESKSRYSVSFVEPMLISMNLANSLSVDLPDPSAILVGIETEALLICEVRPKVLT